MLLIKIHLKKGQINKLNYIYVCFIKKPISKPLRLETKVVINFVI